MNKIRFRIIRDDDEITIILEDGGIATIRAAEESSKGV